MKWFLNQELKTLLDFLSNPGSGNLQQDGKELLQLTGHGVPLLASAMNYDELVSLANDADMDVTPGPRPNARDPSRCDPDESSRNLVVSANGESGNSHGRYAGVSLSLSPSFTGGAWCSSKPTTPSRVRKLQLWPTNLTTFPLSSSNPAQSCRACKSPSPPKHNNSFLLPF